MFRKSRKRMGLWLNCYGLSLLFIATSIITLISLLNVSGAADYPTKPIQVIVPFGPGGGSDIIARLASDKASALVGQPMVVLNKVGGGGTLGTYAVLAAPADGYTILLMSPTPFFAPLVAKGITYNSLKDFTLINLSVTTPCVLVVRKDARWTTLEELVSEAKKNPGKLTYSSPGYGSTIQFVGELFKINAGIDLNHIPMDGTPQSITAILGGHIDMTFSDYGSVYRYMEAGSLKALAVMGEKHLKNFPAVPTVVEKAYPNILINSWQAFAMRSETPKEIVKKLEGAFNRALKDNEVIEKFEKMGWILENLDSDKGTELVARDHKKRSEVARTANILPR